MKISAITGTALAALVIVGTGHCQNAATPGPGGMTLEPEAGLKPEHIYQKKIDWNNVMGTWEVLPEVNPLAERPKTGPGRTQRTLMTLREDGTCRVFDTERPTGSDGLWTYEKNRLYIGFPDSDKIEYLVYGVRLRKDGGFMITDQPGHRGKYVLWSKVK
jgi:hypothetical protein